MFPPLALGILWDYYSLKLQSKQYKRNTSPNYKTEIKILASLLNYVIYVVITQVPVRLNGARSNYSGRVEVFYRGKWGRICLYKWDIDDAQVICRQLGFKNAIAEFTGSDVEDSKVPFLMSGVDCTGSEYEIASCARTDGEANCQGDVGAHALCEPCKKHVYGVLKIFYYYYYYYYYYYCYYHYHYYYLCEVYMK